MLSLQEGVKQIYSQPKSFYFLTGPEYGIKSVYITHLKQYYNNVEEHEFLEDLINVLSKKSLIPREPTLYIVRYDKSFISNLKTLSSNLFRLNFQGTIIGVYQDENDESKLDKYFPDNVLRLNYLTKEIFIKNLKKEFNNFSEFQINAIINCSDNFYKAMIIGQALKVLPENYLNSLTSQDIINIFGSQEYQNEDKIKRYFAAKNFKELVKELDANKYDLNDVFYIFLNSCLEIIKVLEKPYYDSDMKKYKNLWSLSSVTLLFEEIYKQLDKLRNYSNYKEYDAMIYICSLLNFKLD